jgi:YD repeat-containing protein
MTWRRFTFWLNNTVWLAILIAWSCSSAKTHDQPAGPATTTKDEAPSDITTPAPTNTPTPTGPYQRAGDGYILRLSSAFDWQAIIRRVDLRGLRKRILKETGQYQNVDWQTVTEHTYNSDGKTIAVVTTEYRSGVKFAELRESYEYNTEGRVARTIYQGDTETFQYDSAGRLTSSSLSNSSNSVESAYTYDDEGRLLKVTSDDQTKRRIVDPVRYDFLPIYGKFDWETFKFEDQTIPIGTVVIPGDPTPSTFLGFLQLRQGVVGLFPNDGKPCSLETNVIVCHHNGVERRSILLEVTDDAGVTYFELRVSEVESDRSTSLSYNDKWQFINSQRKLPSETRTESITYDESGVNPISGRYQSLGADIITTFEY